MSKRCSNTLNDNQVPAKKRAPQVSSTVSSIYSATSLVISPRDEVLVDLSHPIKCRDVQECLLWLLAPTQAPPPSRFSVANMPLLSLALVVVIDSLPLSSLSGLTSMTSAPLLFPGHWLGSPLPFLAPSSHQNVQSIFKFLFTLSRSKFSKKSEEVSKSSTQSTSITLNDLLLDRTQLAANGFPSISEVGSTRNKVSGPDSLPFVDSDINAQTKGITGLPLVALDCEMVKCGSFYSVARISLVNDEGEVVMDEFVKPDKEITDYVTTFSGISPETLEGVSTSLAQARYTLLSFIGSETIIVGHSLENDLHSLGIVHGKVIDTSVIFPHPQWETQKGYIRKFPLRALTSQYLGRTIQTSTSGHDSVEDCRACIDLLKLKLEKGLEFGHAKVETEPLTSFVSNVSNAKSCFIGPRQLLSSLAHGCQSDFVVDSNEKAVESAVKQLSSDWPKLIAVSLAPPNDLQELDVQLITLMSSLPSNCAFFLISGGQSEAIDRIRQGDVPSHDLANLIEKAVQGAFFCGTKS
ncbi:hypothetical protein RCL1_006718 [Eukaryota sp. TZLM3-RCL]